MVFRIFVEKKEPHNVEAKKTFREIKGNVETDRLKNLRIVNRYDVQGVTREIFEKAKHTVFSEPMADVILENLPLQDKNTIIFAVEALPGQYDQRADSCSQCLQLMTGGVRPAVKYAKVYILEFNSAGDDTDVSRGAEEIKNYLINKVESQEASLKEYQTLDREYDILQTVEFLDDFIDLTRDELEKFPEDRALAMDPDDILFCQDYFKNFEKRNPTITEIKVIDTYWSDHCRHTTFLTEITDFEIADPIVRDAFIKYLDLRKEIYKENNEKSITLMDIATIGAKYLKKQGKLGMLDESGEINACSVNIKVNIDGEDEPEDYLLMFKNETHNHPTEIEPFGGAATCLGGAIRDPLSGRSYVYQAMRVTGSADPREKNNIKNKLSQAKITKGAADGYSSYGNQVGLATGGVYEIYHPDYAAKRLEIGAVIGAAPKANVKRMLPEPGDAVILIGGRTGRDGCGGASGSSKSHTSKSLGISGAEVQKGNPPEERKLQRLFRNPEAAKMIKRCNDFGAGGVSVAIGELADGVFVDLSLVPKKYEGLDGTELAISESQERLAAVVSDENVKGFIREANLENLEATKVASITGDNRFRMVWNKNRILSLDRNFLNSNGAKKQTKVEVRAKNPDGVKEILAAMYQKIKNDDIKQAYMDLLSDLNICSLKGLAQQFGSSIGAGTVISPFGGRHRLTPAQFMAAKIPVLNGNTDTSSVMAYGFSPYVSEISPYRGALYAVVESVSKLIAAGVCLSDIYLSFQEYFPDTRNDPKRFGPPFEALLGALFAQIALDVAAIGGKDSMSGSYRCEDEETGEQINMDVPPTLVSFAVGTAGAEKIVSNEFKKPSSYVYLFKPAYKEDGTVDFEDLKNLYAHITELIEKKLVLSSYAIGSGGIGEAVFKMCIGNNIGFKFTCDITKRELFSSFYGAFIIETESVLKDFELLGHTDSNPDICVNNTVLRLKDLACGWLLPLEEIFPTELKKIKEDIKINIPEIEYHKRAKIYNCEKFAKPRVLIPVFPGTNCEYDSAKQFDEAGGLSDIFVFKNRTSQDISQSADILAQKIYDSQILMLPGGFSGGDEPDGSGKFIAAVFRNPKIIEAARDLLFKKDGLILGICNGFQALIKLGLLPYGDIKEVMSEDDPTLTFNRIGRHQSFMAYTRVASVKSPWFAGVNVGDIHVIPADHGEGRFYIPDSNPDLADILIQNGQIAAQYCDINGNPTMHPYYNPNSSLYAIEGLFSPDGRIFGKMAHSERIGANVMKNVPGNKDQLIFLSGVGYFK